MMQAMMLFKLEGMLTFSQLMKKKFCTSGSESVGLQSCSASCCFFLLFVLYSRRQDAQYFPVNIITVADATCAGGGKNQMSKKHFDVKPNLRHG